MKIAVSSTGPTLEDMVDPRFGRCGFFLIIDTDSMDLESIQNQSATLGGGAGIQSAQLVVDKGAMTVLTGNCGPKATQTFCAAGVQVITGISGPVQKAVEQYQSGALAANPGPSVPEKI